ncbi:hypothetical protein YN1HA_4330 [Sulfurisphaera ohwakuensis]
MWQTLGEYIKEPSKSYIVTKEDIELFERSVRKNRCKVTAQERINYLKRALAELNYE